MRKTALTAVAASLLIALAAGCGPDSTDDGSPTGNDDGVTGQVVLHVTYAVTGNRPVSGTVDADADAWSNGVLLPAESCGQYAAGGPNDKDVQTFVLPQSDRDVTVGGKNAYLVLSVKGYNGPGSYEGSKAITGIYSGDTPGIWIDSKDEGQAFVFSKDSGSTTTVTVKADGSGSWTFTNFWLSESLGANKELASGSVTWTCEKS